jgi:hypothetical protein
VAIGFTAYGLEIASHIVRKIAYNLRDNRTMATEMLCKPFTYGNYSEHIPNNTDYTVTPSPSGGTMVVAQGCTPISSADPQIAAYHKIAG